MRHDRKGIPKEVKAIGNREEKSVLYVYHKEKNIMLAFYIDKKKLGKNNVIVLSTMHDSVKETNDQRKKPQIHSMYDRTKRGVDVVDLLSTSHIDKNKVQEMAHQRLRFHSRHLPNQRKTDPPG